MPLPALLLAMTPPQGGAAGPVPSYGRGAAPAALARVWCTDEDVAVRAPVDFPALAPASQKLAAGPDGAFAPGNPWVLTSASADFSALGVRPNHVVILSKGGGAFTPGGEAFAVDSASGGALVLRRLGQWLTVGQPPGGSGLGGVAFEVRTFGPQIDNASFDADKFFGVDEAVPDRAPGQLYDPRELRAYTVLSVLKWAYLDKVKGAQTDFAEKLRLTSDELESARARVRLHWGSGAQAAPASTPFGKRR